METRKYKQVPSINRVGGRNPQIPAPVIVSCGNRNSKTIIERNKHIVEAISQKAKEIMPKDAEVILFGSRARGDERPDSDWDILILLDKEKVTGEDMVEYSYPLREMGWDYNECINAILFTKAEWQKNIASPFYENVNRDGIRL